MLLYAMVALAVGVALDAYALWVMCHLPEAADYKAVPERGAAQVD